MKVEKSESPVIGTNVKIAFFMVLSFLFLFGAYSAYVLGRSIKLYNYVKLSKRGVSGHISRPDKELGFETLPGTKGNLIFPIGPTIPVVYDQYGFRVPEGESVSPAVDQFKKPTILSIGCSFTEGDACFAEDAYSYQLSKILGTTVLNAGTGSYGYGGMLIRARRLIPKYKPDYVIVQYSHWLQERAMDIYGPSYFGLTPVPYFIDGDGKNKVLLQYPVFDNKMVTLNLSEYRSTPKGVKDFLVFMAKGALPMFLHDDYHSFVVKVKRNLRLMPYPTENEEGLVTDVFEQIKQICDANGAKMIVLVLGNSTKKEKLFDGVKNLGVPIVDGHSAILKALPQETDEIYFKTYAHWRGDPPVLVDNHPNSAAHRIFAEELAKVFKTAIKNK